MFRPLVELRRAILSRHITQTLAIRSASHGAQGLRKTPPVMWLWKKSISSYPVRS